MQALGGGCADEPQPAPSSSSKVKHDMRGPAGAMAQLSPWLRYAATHPTHVWWQGNAECQSHICCL